MNNPHTANTADDRQDDDMKTTIVDSDFGEFLDAAYEVWQNLATPEQKADEIRELVLKYLDGDGADDNTTLPHTQSVEDHRLESDAMGLMGCTIIPRKMSKAELQAAADRLVGPRTVEDDILEAIKRREARNLTAYRGGYHQ